jgi:hypothetical protein
VFTVMLSLAYVRASPRDIETTPPLLAEYTTDPPNPPVHQPCEVKLMIRPPRPCSRMICAAARLRKKPAFRFVLYVPILFGDLIHVVAADQHACNMGEYIQCSKLFGHASEQDAVAADVAEFDCPRAVWAARKRGDQSLEVLVAHVDCVDGGTCLGEGPRDGLSDPARSTRDYYDLALEPRFDIPTHHTASIRLGVPSNRPRGATARNWDRFPTLQGAFGRCQLLK